MRSVRRSVAQWGDAERKAEIPAEAVREAPSPVASPTAAVQLGELEVAPEGAPAVVGWKAAARLAVPALDANPTPGDAGGVRAEVADGRVARPGGAVPVSRRATRTRWLPTKRGH